MVFIIVVIGIFLLGMVAGFGAGLWLFAKVLQEALEDGSLEDRGFLE